MLKIVQAPNPVLSQKTKEVKKIDKSILKLLEGMTQALLSAKDPVGVGLAAPQVEKSLQIFIAKPTLKSKNQVFINPKIIQKTKISHLTTDNDRGQQLNDISTKKLPANPRQTKLEGCLSLPNIWGEVKRESEITVSYLDEKGNLLTRKFSGFIATIIQHELDHLNGILFTKRVLEQKGTLYKSHKDEKGEDVFEELEI